MSQYVFCNIMVVTLFRVLKRPEALIAIVAPTSHVSPWLGVFELWTWNHFRHKPRTLLHPLIHMHTNVFCYKVYNFWNVKLTYWVQFPGDRFLARFPLLCILAGLVLPRFQVGSSELAVLTHPTLVFWFFHKFRINFALGKCPHKLRLILRMHMQTPLLLIQFIICLHITH
jgi:hypothetical protein